MSTRTDPAIRSDTCHLGTLINSFTGDVAFRPRLVLDGRWPRGWSTTWLFGGDQVAWPVRDLEAVPVLTSQPVRRFGWRPRQRHRPGLQFMVSTGRHHGFESLEEQRLLLALDFLTVVEVLPQPFRLDFEHQGGRAQHTPDFLAVLPGGAMVLLDVRPASRIEDGDALKFAAAREVATSCGWQYVVVTGWHAHVHSVLDHLSSQRRPLKDQLGLQSQLLDAAARRPVAFGELVAQTRLPAVARAHATHLLWHRRLAIGLGRPLGDSSMVWPGLDAPRRH